MRGGVAFPSPGDATEGAPSDAGLVMATGGTHEVDVATGASIGLGETISAVGGGANAGMVSSNGGLMMGTMATTSHGPSDSLPISTSDTSARSSDVDGAGLMMASDVGTVANPSFHPVQKRRSQLYVMTEDTAIDWNVIHSRDDIAQFWNNTKRARRTPLYG